MRNDRSGRKGWVIVAAAVMVAACGGHGGAGRLELPAVGFSMAAPRGWEVSTRSPDLCSRGGATGLVMVEPLDGARFTTYVDRVAREFGAEVMARRVTTVAGHRAVELVSAYPDQGTRALRLFIDLDERVLMLSFVVPEGEFPAEEGTIRAAMDTIQLG